MRGHFTSHRLQKRPPGTRALARRGEERTRARQGFGEGRGDRPAGSSRDSRREPFRRPVSGRDSAQSPQAVCTSLGREDGACLAPHTGSGPPLCPAAARVKGRPAPWFWEWGTNNIPPPHPQKKREEERERKKMYVSFLGEAVVRREKEAPASRGCWTEGGAPVLILGVRGGVWGALTAPSPKPRDSFPGDQKNSPQARCKSLHHVI